MERDHIDPMIIRGVGECIECGGQVVVVDMETTFMKLDTNGAPISEDTIIRCEGVCNHCGKRIPMIRNGMNYMVDNNYNKFCRNYGDLVFRNEVIERMECLKPSDDNPFCLYTTHEKGEK